MARRRSSETPVQGQDLVLLISVHDWNRIGADVLLGLARSPRAPSCDFVHPFVEIVENLNDQLCDRVELSPAKSRIPDDDSEK